MREMQNSLGGGAGAAALNNQLTHVQTALAGATAGLQAWQRVQGQSNADIMTQQIKRQEIGWMNLRRAMAESGMVVRQQMQMQNALGNSVSQTTMRLAVKRDIMASAADNTVKWGKNMQWAGRQLTVGLTLPIMMAGRAMTRLAEDVDMEVTRIVKVYNFGTDATVGMMQQVEETARQTARSMSAMFGQTEHETLQMMTTFAQMGRTGEDLTRMTEMASRTAFLGNVDHATSVNLVRSTMDAFRLTADETAATLDRFNQIENTTVLTQQDIANELTDVAGTLNNFNFSAEQGAAMMTAMKERGVEVNRAVTSLRFGMARIFAPTNRAAESFQALGIDLRNLAKSVEDPMDMIYGIADALGTIEDEQERYVKTVELFGQRQADVWLQLLDSVKEGSRETGGFAAAMEAAGMSAEEAARRGDREVKMFQESFAGQMQILRTEIKAIAQAMGKEILPTAIWFMNVFKSLLGWISELPEPIRKFTKYLLTAVAVAGPLIMLVGLFANFFGMITKGLVSVFGLGVRLRLMTDAQFAAAAAAKNNTQAMMGQTNQYQALADTLRNATREMMMHSEVMSMMDAQGRLRRPAGLNAPAGQFMSLTEGRDIAAARVDAAEAQRIADAQADASHRSARGWRFAAAGVGMMVGGLIASNAEAGSLQALVGKIVMGFSTMLMFLPQITSLMRVLATAVHLTLLPFTLIVGTLTAIVGGILLLRRHIKGLEESMYDAAEGAEAIASSLDVDWAEIGTSVNEVGEEVLTVAARMRKFREENEELVEQMRRMNARSPQELQDYAVQMGYELVRHGATPEEAKDAVQVALRAAGAVQLAVEFDLEDIDGKVAAMQRDIERIVNQDNRGRWEKFGNFLGFGTGIGAEDEERAKNIGRSIAKAVAEGAEEAKTEFEGAVTGFTTQFEKIRDQISQEDLLKLKEHGIDLMSSTADLNAEFLKAGVNLGGWSNEAVRAINSADELRIAEQLAAQELAREMGLRDEVIKQITNMKEAREALVEANGNVMAAEAEYNTILAERVMRGEQLTDDMKNELLISIYLKHGLNELAAALGHVADEAERLGGIDTEGDLEETNKTVDTFLSKLRSNMRSGLQELHRGVSEQHDAITQNAMDNFKKQEEAAKKSFDEQAKASDKSFDRQLKAADKAADAAIKASDRRYDRMIKEADEANKVAIKSVEKRRDSEVKAITDVQEAEERRERMRQQLFQREQMRLSYLAGQYNTQIQFDVAMVGGDFGQAAILREQAIVEEAKYADELAAMDAKNAEERKKEERDKRIEGIKEAADKRIESLKKEGAAVKEQLQEEKRLRNEALREEKDRTRERIREAKDAARESIKAAQEQRSEEIRLAADAHKRMRDEHKKRLDKEHEELTRSVPKTQAEYNSLIKKLETLYSGYGVTLKTKSGEWNDEVQQTWTRGVKAARDDMSEDRKWEVFGQKTGDAAMRGMLGMSMGQFKHWVETGEALSDKQWREKNLKQSGGKDAFWTASHTGGPVTGGKGNRLGRTGPLWPDEVPTILQKGEYVVDRKTTQKLGAGFFDSLKGMQQSKPVTGAYMHGGGLRGAMGALALGAIKQAATAGLTRVAERKNEQIMAGQAGQMMTVLSRFATADPGVGMGGLSGLEAFMEAIAKLESSGRYNLIGPRHATMGHALGKYQIMESNWPAWSRAAGVAGRNWSHGSPQPANANWRPPANQDAVARKIMGDYYNKYKSWEATAVAWFAGPSRAERYLKGDGSVNSLRDSLGTSVASYIQRVMSTMRELEADVVPAGGATATGNWPPRRWATASSNTLAARSHIARNWPSTRNGGDLGLNRGVANSDHSWGKALDIYPGTRPGQYANAQQAAEGWNLANWFLRNPNRFGTKYAIWQKKIQSPGGARREYTRYGARPGPVLGHFDHIHLSFKHLGGLVDGMTDQVLNMRKVMQLEGQNGMQVPSLARGGKIKYDNTLANLHKGERVLTASLSDKLERGVQSISNGGDSFDIKIYATPDMDVNRLANEVVRKIQSQKKRKGIDRSV
jgi:TP901 family phage tail tape measure protein